MIATSLPRWPQSTVRVGCVIVFLTSVVVLLGWVFEISPLRSVFPNLPMMSPSAALLLALLGIGLAFIAIDATISGNKRSALETQGAWRWVPRGIALTKSLRDVLEADGRVVVTTGGGKEGIDAFREAEKQGDRFAVVLTDLGMPHIDGHKVAAAVKEIPVDACDSFDRMGPTPPDG